MNTTVSFDISKELKEKGFDKQLEEAFYSVYDIEDKSLLKNVRQTTLIIGQDLFYYAPIIAEVVMWLYEKHGIWIEVVWDIELNKELKWYSGITNVGDSSELEIFQSNPCDTPTEAYSQAIEYTLKNLI